MTPYSQFNLYLNEEEEDLPSPKNIQPIATWYHHDQQIPLEPILIKHKQISKTKEQGDAEEGGSDYDNNEESKEDRPLSPSLGLMLKEIEKKTRELTNEDHSSGSSSPLEDLDEAQ
jgi:hypothetical protein